MYCDYKVYLYNADIMYILMHKRGRCLSVMQAGAPAV